MQDSLTDAERTLIADQLAQYYDWLAGHGGVHPDQLLTFNHTAEQRKVLLARMDDLNIIMGQISTVSPILSHALSDAADGTGNES